MLIFKITDKDQRLKWKSIAILNTQTLGHFDNSIRDAFDHDTDDHLSEFYRTKAFTDTEFGEIEPGGSGIGSKWQLSELNFALNEVFEYVYDFGSSSIYIQN